MKIPTITDAINRMPKFMNPELEPERVSTFSDLLFQVVHEIDMAEDGEVDPKWTKRQLHSAKMYAANVKIWALSEVAEVRL